VTGGRVLNAIGWALVGWLVVGVLGSYLVRTTFGLDPRPWVLSVVGGLLGALFGSLSFRPKE
jgi:hypothetical protein